MHTTRGRAVHATIHLHRPMSPAGMTILVFVLPADIPDHTPPPSQAVFRLRSIWSACTDPFPAPGYLRSQGGIPPLFYTVTPWHTPVSYGRRPGGLLFVSFALGRALCSRCICCVARCKAVLLAFDLPVEQQGDDRSHCPADGPGCPNTGRTQCCPGQDHGKHHP